ncbi:MAG: hypothetical protein JW891_04990 [Candidatus Lokiarchaeota archaeon]|nr:hypothetical protein [Candidatus Lokiarchaeota archaeon]
MNISNKNKIKSSLIFLAIFLPIIFAITAINLRNDEYGSQQQQDLNTSTSIYYIESVECNLISQSFALNQGTIRNSFTHENWEDERNDAFTRYHYVTADCWQNYLEISETSIFQLDDNESQTEDADIHIHYSLILGSRTSINLCQLRIYNYDTLKYDLLSGVTINEQIQDIDVLVNTLNYINDEGKIQIQVLAWAYNEQQIVGWFWGLAGPWYALYWAQYPIFGTLWPEISIKMFSANVDLWYLCEVPISVY